jgi:hypothetical protein
VAAHGFQTYLDDKTDLKPSDDPVEDLRAGWDLHVGFGPAHPAIYSLMYGYPRPGASARAAAAATADTWTRACFFGRGAGTPV